MDAVTIIVGVILVIIVLIVTVVNNQRVSDLQNSMNTTQTTELPSTSSSAMLVKDDKFNYVPARPFYLTLGPKPVDVATNPLFQGKNDVLYVSTDTTDGVDFLNRIKKVMSTGTNSNPMTIYLPDKLSLWKVMSIKQGTTPVTGDTTITPGHTYDINIERNGGTSTTKLFSPADLQPTPAGSVVRRTVMLVEAQMTGSTVSGV